MHAIEPMMSRQARPDYSCWAEVLQDQTKVLIRPISKEDAAAERVFIEALSPQVYHYRFLCQVPHPGATVIGPFTDVDHSHDLAFAAVVRDDGKDKFVGVGRYNTTASGDFECTVTVLDDWQSNGLGAILMEHLIDVARSRGITCIWSLDSANNLVSPLLGFAPQPGSA